MKGKRIKIGTQMASGFAIVLTFVVLLGLVTSIQTSKLFQHEKTLYEHPLQVKEAIDELYFDILTSRVGIRDLVLAQDETAVQETLQSIELSFTDMQGQYEILYDLYLGPVAEVDEAYDAFIKWKIATENRIELIQAGQVENVVESLGDQGDVGIYRNQLTASIDVLDNFASNKANELYGNYIEEHRVMSIARYIMVAVILLISIIISIVLTRMIRRPLAELNKEIMHFHQGNLNARCHYDKNNEFGTLSDSFNTMADKLQSSIELTEKTAALSEIMLSQEDAKMFFKSTLGALAEHTGSQIAAVYLLSEDKTAYVHFESIGLDGNGRDTFDAKDLEGEFGSAISSRKCQYITQIPEDTRFNFLTTGGHFVPREIITIPILAGNEIIAIISLASIRKFYTNANKLIENILDTMSARISGVLAMQTIKSFIAILEQQNQELDAQKNELTAQASELKQQNAELDMQKTQLSEASMLKTTFLSNMSHELRTPLNSIIALSGVLYRRLANEIPAEEHDYLEVIERNGKNLLELINDILDISRIEAGREEIEISNFNINSVITDIVSMLEPQVKQRGIALTEQLSAPNVSITSDAKKCHHIFQNIIGNAVKFTETGGVNISVVETGNHVMVKVSDTGIGISEKHLPHIFDEFRQADGTTSRRFGGTGLGLAIAKKYTDLLGGSILVTSELGKGSEFTVTLPKHFISESASEKAASSAEYLSPLYIGTPVSQISDPGGKVILLIEDSEPAVVQIKDLMEKSGHRILVASNATQAYKIVEDTIPDAIILDLMMPDIDGFETLNTLRATEKTAEIPVLILTAKHITSDELKFLKKNHIHQIIQKGDVNRNELLSAVSSVLYPGGVEKTNRYMKATSENPVVLVVEDNADSMTTIKAVLADQYHVIEATGGEEGIALAKKYLPNLVLMDIALPMISGIEAFHAIRQSPETQHIPIVALTASAMVQERACILSHGFDAFIAKPIIVDDLFEVISEVLYGR